MASFVVVDRDFSQTHVFDIEIIKAFITVTCLHSLIFEIFEISFTINIFKSFFNIDLSIE